MAYVVSTNKQGYTQLRDVDDPAIKEQFELGVLIGPPDLSDIPDISAKQRRELNNALIGAGIVTYEDIKTKREIMVAVVNKLFADKTKARMVREWLLAIYLKSYHPEIYGED